MTPTARCLMAAAVLLLTATACHVDAVSAVLLLAGVVCLWLAWARWPR